MVDDIKMDKIDFNILIYSNMLKALKVRIYPTKSQQELLAKLFGDYRFVYNRSLALKESTYKNLNKSLSQSDLQKYFHSRMVIENEFLQEFNSNILKGAIMVLDQAFQRFYKKQAGYPQYKSKFYKQSVKFFTPTCISRTNLEDGKINLTKNLKGFKFKTSDKYLKYLLKYRKNIKNITISKENSGHYFASILIDSDETLKGMSKPINDIQGFDLGIKTLIVGSKGEEFNNLHFHKSQEKRFKHLQQELSRKKKGSKNKEKARLKLAKCNEKINNKKSNYIHNITSKMVSENQTIVLEDLNVSGMMKNHKLAKAIQELSLYEIRRQIEYKTKFNDREVIFINRFFPSSKKCSRCGHIHKELTLADRIFICPSCGLVIDRDLNAAINIEMEGLRIRQEKLGKWLPDNKLVELPLTESSTLVDDSYVTMKQELSLVG